MKKNIKTRNRILSAFLGLALLKLALLVQSWPMVDNLLMQTPLAQAQEKSATTAKTMTDRAATQDAATDSAKPKEPAPGELDMEILQNVARRQKELDLKEEKLKRREEQLNTMKADLDKQITQLTALRAQIDERIKLRDDLENKAVKKLAKTYSSMPPENAAILIQKIDRLIAIRVLSAMKERSAGRILALVPPALASKLSEGLVKKK